MAWKKGEPHERILAPDLNDVIRDNNDALEAALNAWTEFETGGTQTGHPRQGSARVYFQDSAPTERLDGNYFDSTDLGCIWIDSNSDPDNQFNILTAADGVGNETWTPISDEIIAVLLAVARTFADVVTFSKNPVFTKGIVANDSFLQGRNNAGDGNVDIAKVNTSDEIEMGAITQLPDTSKLATSGAPAADEQLANKKYVDDQIDNSIGQSSQATGTDNISNSSGDWADMADMSITITTKGGNVLLLFSAPIKKGEIGDAIVSLRFDCDDTSYGICRDDIAEENITTISYLLTGLSAAEHTFKVQWKDYEGTIEQIGTTYPRVFTAIELPS